MLVLLVGNKEHGKSTLAMDISNEYQTTQIYSLASPLYALQVDGVKNRAFLQDMGMLMRQHYGATALCELLDDMGLIDGDSLTVIDDVRTSEEVQYFADNYDCIAMHVFRKGIKEDEYSNHHTEKAVETARFLCDFSGTPSECLAWLNQNVRLKPYART